MKDSNKKQTIKERKNQKAEKDKFNYTKTSVRDTHVDS